MILSGEVNINKTGDDEYIIENTKNNTYVKMGERETGFLRSFSMECEGSKDFGFSQEEREYLIKTFLELKLIKDENDSDEEKKSIFNSLKRLDISKIKIYTFNPEKLFQKVAPVTDKLITKPALAIYLTIMAAGLFAVIINNEEFIRVTINVMNEMNLFNVAVLYGLTAVTIGIHEFCHGITCKKYTNKVKEMGVMLFYFQPAMYCNVSSVYLLKDKKKKAIIFGAGIFSQLLLSAVSVLVYFSLSRLGYKPSVLIYYSLSNVAVAIYNLVPFIKLDGYWILSTLLDIQNFREKSIDLVLAFVLRKNIKERYERRKVLLASYGILAMIFTSSVWIALLIQVNNYTSNIQNAVFRMAPAVLAGIIAFHLIKTLKVKRRDFAMREAL